MQKGWIVAAIVAGCALAMYGGWKLRDLQANDDVGRTANAESSELPTVGTGLGPRGSAGLSQRLESRTERAARIAAARDAQRDQTRAVVAAGKQNLESAFRSEKTNPTWARGKELELERYVVNPQMDSLNAIPTEFDVECKSSTCRIEAEFASPSAADDWATLYLTNNGGLLPRSTLSKVRQPDGTVKLVMVGSTI